MPMLNDPADKDDADPQVAHGDGVLPRKTDTTTGADLPPPVTTTEKAQAESEDGSADAESDVTSGSSTAPDSLKPIVSPAHFSDLREPPPKASLPPAKPVAAALEPIVDYPPPVLPLFPPPVPPKDDAGLDQPPEAADAVMPDHIADLSTTDAVKVTGVVSEKTAADPAVSNIGWNEPPHAIPSPIVTGIDNGVLWTLVRRFDKQMYHVKRIPDTAVGNLDLQVSDEEEFSPDKLRANLERLYMTVLIGIMAFIKHIARLRSWNERRRTGIACAAYVLAWATGYLLPLILTVLLALVLFPPARAFLFPPAPLAIVSGKSGNLQTPRAGTLGSGDSLTGAPQNHAGEAVEQEASNFVSGFASLAVGTALGKHPDGDAEEGTSPNDQPIDKALPDPANIAITTVDAKDKAHGEGLEVGKDKTKQPMEVVIWSKARPAMRALSAVADTWEMFGNALSPTPPFNHFARYKLAAVLAPLILVTAVTPSWVLVKLLGAGVGFGFFGQPAIDRGVEVLNRKYPKWERMLDLRNSLLLGVPTNAQLTITLLRIGEANKAPLPPPPNTKTAPPSEPSSPIIAHDDLPEDLKASELEVTPRPEEAPEVAHGPGEKSSTKHKVMSKVAGLLKGTTKTAVSGVLTADHVKAGLGSANAKQRIGIIPGKTEGELVDGPSVFEARYQGKKGHVVINTTATSPCVSFIAQGNKKDSKGEWVAAWSVGLADIKELKKLGGLGWKGKLIVGWAYEKEVYDGLEIVDGTGASWVLTAMRRRDELFNRLVAIVSHKWESW